MKQQIINKEIVINLNDDNTLNEIDISYIKDIIKSNFKKEIEDLYKHYKDNFKTKSKKDFINFIINYFFNDYDNKINKEIPIILKKTFKNLKIENKNLNLENNKLKTLINFSKSSLTIKALKELLNKNLNTIQINLNEIENIKGFFKADDK